MKSIFVEGLQGMGKSTLIQKLSLLYPDARVYREGDYCPVELAWCSYVTQEEYHYILEKYQEIEEEIKKWTVFEDGMYVVMYTRIITDIPGFHKDMEQYEIYNGRCSLAELETIVLKRYQRYAQNQTGEKEISFFECALFQNIIEDLMLFHCLDDDQISQFYKRLNFMLDKCDFQLFYLYDEKVEECINRIIKERCDEDGNPAWLPLMEGYIETSPMGQKCGLKGYEGLVAHLKHRQKLELRIIQETFYDRCIVLPAKNYSNEELFIR